MKDFFSKRDEIRSFLRIWSHLLRNAKKSVNDNDNSLYLFNVECNPNNCNENYNIANKFQQNPRSKISTKIRNPTFIVLTAKLHLGHLH